MTEAPGTPGSKASDAQRIVSGYATSGAALELGAVVLDGAVHPDAQLRIALSMLNRHGLIAGATGTGKTKTLQGLAEQLSAAGVPVVVADVKGDLSGLAQAGATNDKIAQRVKDTGGGQLLGDQLQRLGLPRAGRAGDEPVPVQHRERDPDPGLGMRAAAQHDRAELDGRPLRRIARRDLRGGGGRVGRLALVGHAGTVAVGRAARPVVASGSDDFRVPRAGRRPGS